jgi:hypothetical protein
VASSGSKILLVQYTHLRTYVDFYFFSIFFSSSLDLLKWSGFLPTVPITYLVLPPVGNIWSEIYTKCPTVISDQREYLLRKRTLFCTSLALPFSANGSENVSIFLEGKNNQKNL